MLDGPEYTANSTSHWYESHGKSLLLEAILLAEPLDVVLLGGWAAGR